MADGRPACLQLPVSHLVLARQLHAEPEVLPAAAPPPTRTPSSCQVTNLCGGFLATRYSAKGVLAMGVVLWSIFTIATPAAAAAGDVGTLVVARWGGCAAVPWLLAAVQCRGCTVPLLTACLPTAGPRLSLPCLQGDDGCG